MAEGRTVWPPVKFGWFVEPVASTSFLLAREEDLEAGFWDPACGQGNTIEAARLAGAGPCFGTDIVRRTPEPWFMGRVDFLAQRWRKPLSPRIVTNPPYGKAKLAEAFIRHAIAIPGVELVCVFVNAKFLFGSGRAAGLYAEHPPTRIWPVYPRPSCPPGEFLLQGGKAEGGVENFCWLVWSIGAPPRSDMIWRGPDA